MLEESLAHVILPSPCNAIIGHILVFLLQVNLACPGFLLAYNVFGGNMPLFLVEVNLKQVRFIPL